MSPPKRISVDETTHVVDDHRWGGHEGKKFNKIKTMFAGINDPIKFELTARNYITLN
jgi:hypothetical protein